MFRLKTIFIIYFMIFSICLGCATLSPQTEALLKATPENQQSHLIESVPFVDQPLGHCGPSSLTMVMNWSGYKISEEKIANEVYTPGMKGSLQSDLIGASRRHGFMALTVDRLESLFAEVRVGHPVIIFENLGLNWIPQWHYAVVVGFDLAVPEVILHSGHNAYTHVDLYEFEKSWQLGDYWGLVVLPPNQLSLTNNEFSNIRAAASLEQVGRLNEAKQAYQQILNIWPTSLGALIGLANITYMQKEKVTAEKYLLIATTLYPKSAAAWHNLAIIQSSLNLKAKAHQSTVRALNLASDESKEKYFFNLRQLLQ
jgi:hypothetical protein